MNGNPLTPEDFPAFFAAVHGVPPFPWQVRLLLHLAEKGGWPSVLDLPTGSGKTAALDIAVFHLAMEAARSAGRRAPMRIAFVVDRRLIVDDAFERAMKLARRLADPSEPVLRQVKSALCALAGSDHPLLVRRLRGGAPREDDWARTPCQPTILCSTVDQVGSRLLFRGYGISDRMKPVHAGLLGSDCLVLLDEAHLAEPFRQTLDAIRNLRGPDAAIAPWQLALLSATPGVQPAAADGRRQPIFKLNEHDRADAVLAKRLAVSKPAMLIEIAGKQGVPTEDRRVEALVEQTKAMLEKLRTDIANPAIGVVVNRVARARKVFERLDSELPHAKLVLIIGPARPIEREEQAACDLQPIRTDPTAQPRDLAEPLIVVATQTIEAGVDIDFDGLVTEAAALDALRQRFGRLNRAGRDINPTAAILAHKEDIAPRADDPVYGDRISRTWKALKETPKGSAGGEVEFGINGFPGELLDNIGELAAIKVCAPVLMPAYADLWSQTSPMPNADPDVSLFLHGPDRSAASVQIVWRADIDEVRLREAQADRASRERLLELFAAVPPRSAEAVEVSLAAARRWLPAVPVDQRDREIDFADAPQTEPAAEPGTIDRGRPAFRWAGPESDRSETVYARRLRPNDLIIVPATYGGCDEWGWAPAAPKAVIDLAERAAERYAARRFAVRVTPELIAQWQAEEAPPSDRDPAAFLATVRDALAALLAEHRDAKAPELLDAVIAFPLLPGRLGKWLSLLKDCEGKPEQRFAYGVDDEEPPRGVVFIAPRGLKDRDKDAEQLAALPATESDDIGSAAGKAQFLDEHSKQVRERARQFAAQAGVPPEIADDLALAAYLHDAGKIDPRFQAYLAGGDPFGYDARKVLAKSGRMSLRGARERAKLPENWRHEALSVRLAQLHPEFPAAHDPALVLWLVGVHHGLGRPLFPHADCKDGEARSDLPAALGVEWQLAAGHGPQSLGFDFRGRDWAQIFSDLKDSYGIWGLARLEAILRLADHRASEEVTTGLGQLIDVCVSPKLKDEAGKLTRTHRLEGLEPDNLLAFLALLGLLRTLETVRPQWRPRAAWNLENPPLRPFLTTAAPVAQDEICGAVADGVARLVAAMDFRSAAELKLPCKEARQLLSRVAATTDDGTGRFFADLCAALISDAVLVRDRTGTAPTPLSYPKVARINFLSGIEAIAGSELPEAKNRSRDRKYPNTAAACIDQALFRPWERLDRPPGLRWDPDEAKRHAHQWSAPTDEQPRTQHGANRLAIVGLSTLTAAPAPAGLAVRLLVLGGDYDRDGFSFAWPIWRLPASLSAVRALLSHPDLRTPRALDHFGIDHVRVTRRISLDRYRNFTFAEALSARLQ